MDLYFFFSSRSRHTRWPRDWSSDVCSSDLNENIHKVKSEYIKNSISNNEVAVLIDDDNRILSESLKILGNNVIPIHVTSLLI